MKRVKYLDLVRGLAIFFMIMQHAMLVHEYGAGDSSDIFSVVFVVLGTWPAAPVFMVVMGVFMQQSKMNTRGMMIRGLKLLALGYVLNFVRFTIPLLIVKDNQAFTLLFEIDIFQLAGLSYIILAGLRKVASNKFAFPVIILFIIIISPYLWADINYLTDPFIGINEIVSFPVFPWIIYPMLGMYLSDTLLNMDKKKTIVLSIAAVIALTFGLITLGDHTVYAYPQHTFDVHLIIIAFVLLYLVTAYYISKYIGDIKILTIWSKNITSIYILQWIIYGYSILILNANSFNHIVTMLIGFVVMIIVHLLITKTNIDKFIPKI